MTNQNDHSEQLEILKSSVEDLLRSDDDFGTDYDLLRFLQGFDYNMQTASEHLREHLRFRNAAQPKLGEKCYQRNPFLASSFGQCVPLHPPIFSKQGLLLFVEFMGASDVIGTIKTQRYCFKHLIDDRLQNNEQMWKVIRAREKEEGRQLGIYLIWDCSGFRYTSIDQMYTVFSKLARQYNDFFTRHLIENHKKILIINASPIIYHLWSLCRTFVPRNTKERVAVLSPEDWKAQLLADFDEEVLPHFLGGKNVIEEGPNFNYPKDVPVDDYFDKSAVDLSKYTTINVPGGKSLIGIVHVTDAGRDLKLAWSIFVNGSFNFGIFRKDQNTSLDKEKDEMVCPLYKPLPPAEQRPEFGEIELRDPGFYLVLIENEHYWLFGSLKVEIRLSCTQNGHELNVSYDVV